MFIGYISSKAPEYELSSFDSYLGGSLRTLPSTSFEQACPSCHSCHERMNFIMQIYCPIETCSDHRSLYFFVCLRPSCQSAGTNWRILRNQVPSECVPDHKPHPSDWCVDQGNSDDESSWGGIDEELNQTEETVRGGLESETSTISIESHMTGPFEPRFIDVYEDEDSNKSDASEPNQQPSSTFESWCQAEAIEQEFIEEDDNANSGTFSGALQNYLATRSEYGCEAIRYCWAGKPIFDGRIPKQLKEHLTCHRCGAPRVFELQLFPTLNNSLKLSAAVIRNHADFSSNFINLPNPDKLNHDWLLNITTVLVFSCSASCSTIPDDWIEECVVVQTDSNVTEIRSPKI